MFALVCLTPDYNHEHFCPNSKKDSLILFQVLHVIEEKVRDVISKTAKYAIILFYFPQKSQLEVGVESLP